MNIDTLTKNLARSILLRETDLSQKQRLIVFLRLIKDLGLNDQDQPSNIIKNILLDQGQPSNIIKNILHDIDSHEIYHVIEPPSIESQKKAFVVLVAVQWKLISENQIRSISYNVLNIAQNINPNILQSFDLINSNDRPNLIKIVQLISTISDQISTKKSLSIVNDDGDFPFTSAYNGLFFSDTI